MQIAIRRSACQTPRPDGARTIRRRFKKLALSCGIVHGFAYHNAALDLHPINGNAEMDLIAKQNRFFSSVWLILPNHTREFYDTEELRAKLDESGVEMVRAVP